jgi:hypothetical protein
MARGPWRKLKPVTVRCINEDFHFIGEMEYVGHEVEKPGGGIKWVQGKARAHCPNSPFHRIELVEE